MSTSTNIFAKLPSNSLSISYIAPEGWRRRRRSPERWPGCTTPTGGRARGPAPGPAPPPRPPGYPSCSGPTTPGWRWGQHTGNTAVTMCAGAHGEGGGGEGRGGAQGAGPQPQAQPHPRLLPHAAAGPREVTRPGGAGAGLRGGA